MLLAYRIVLIPPSPHLAPSGGLPICSLAPELRLRLTLLFVRTRTRSRPARTRWRLPQMYAVIVN
ncbi:hypothetical protein J6590_007042 [Homalodisca vitripennis]|nr:hypothetical protein J6590_007042 [Homalodisca vitripennis]